MSEYFANWTEKKAVVTTYLERNTYFDHKHLQKSASWKGFGEIAIK